MTRTTAREIAIHLTFELSFSDLSADELLDQSLCRECFEQLEQEEPLYSQFPNEKQKNYIQTLVRGAFQHGAELDGYIAKYSVGWSFSRIDRVAAAIMRVAMYEIMYMPDIPSAAAINDAVEISKHYEEESTVRFINGILGSFVRQEQIPDPAGEEG
ncbi:MAG: transcription antitermination factor NusB [Oscillospiraceae bacterium]|nr:transcription antitermination factor NusB [Oscillospiraceae bacterium]